MEKIIYARQFKTKEEHKVKMEIRKGDLVTIRVKGREITGRVTYAYFDEGIEEGEGYWLIELDVPGGCYWKQRYDGGEVIAVNGK